MKKIKSMPEHLRPKSQMQIDRFIHESDHPHLDKLPNDETPMETVNFLFKLFD